MQQNEEMPNMITRRELAKFLRVAHNTFRQLIATPRLSILRENEIRIGRQIVYPRASVVQFLAAAAGQK